ncbi:acyl-CoA dehydrogenase family protein [Catellatospora methionotrophica]|uniref:acyl-CoA dehydrogenase family protein n=1 Tax=Catellatospora methionotrophica TaxID=121620 RepID=UPI0033E294BE
MTAWKRPDSLTLQAAAAWDVAGEIPAPVRQELSSQGLLCAEVGAEFGGLGLSSVDNGELSASVGAVCSSVRSLATSSGIAAATVLRFGSAPQREAYLPPLTSGATAAVAFSEAGAGSDLAGLRTTVRRTGDTVEVTGEKVWVTGAAYAGWIVVLGRYETGAAYVMVPADAPGVRIERVAHPLGCRAAGHATVRLDGVRLPASHLLGGAGLPTSFLATSALTYGRISVAWGCVGIIRACLSAAAGHARSRVVGDQPLADRQLIQAHLAELLVAERIATLACEQVSRQCDDRLSEHVMSAVFAKYTASTGAARASSVAVQVLASAGAADGHTVARAYRDAKVMEIIEGSTEVSALLLAGQALEQWA